MSGEPKIELTNIPHPTDQLIVCDDCGESFAAFTTVKEAADWIEEHTRRRHPAERAR
jgi:hypothetical protein